MARTLGYIYVTGGGLKQLFRYDIKQDTWQTFETPFAVTDGSLQYLDDFGGPLSELFQANVGSVYASARGEV